MIKLLSEMINEETAETKKLAEDIPESEHKDDKEVEFDITEIEPEKPEDEDEKSLVIESIKKKLLSFYSKFDHKLSELRSLSESNCKKLCRNECFYTPENVKLAHPLVFTDPTHILTIYKNNDCIISGLSDYYAIDITEENFNKPILEFFFHNNEVNKREINCVKVCNQILNNINTIRDLGYELYEISVKALDDGADVKKIINKFRFSLRYLLLLAVVCSRYVDMIYCKAVSICNPMGEAVQLNNENLDNYINELEKCIEELRDFYDTFKYKELVSPRYKKINKMKEYVIGALKRKYTLKIPMYKILNANENVKDIIETQFIAKLEEICDKYPNYILLTPDFDDNSDMFIYVTLKEPFGDKSVDRADRKIQSEDNKSEKDSEKMNEAIGTVIGIGAGVVSLFTLAALGQDIYKENKADKKLMSLEERKKYYASEKMEPLKKIIKKSVFFRYPENFKDIFNAWTAVYNKIMNDCVLVDKTMKNVSDNKMDNKLADISKKYEDITNNAKTLFKKLEAKFSKSIKWVDSANPTELKTVMLAYIDMIDNNSVRSDMKREKFDPDIKALRNAAEAVEDDDTRLTRNEYETVSDKVQNTLDKFDETKIMQYLMIPFSFIKVKGKLSRKEKETGTITESIILNENKITAEQRNKLDDKMFGIPELKAYPLTDKAHIQKAIQLFDHCEPKYKKELANNILNRMLELDLADKIKIGKDNKNKKYFPKWMLEDNVTVKKDGSKYSVYVNNELYQQYTLNETVCDIQFIL